MKAPARGGLHAVTREGKLLRLPLENRSGVDIEAIEAKGATLRILAMNLDTATPTGRLMLNVLGSVAQWEREMMLERQREGIAKAKAEGKYKGRAKTARKPANYIAVATRLAAGESATKVAADLRISRSSLYRIRDDLKKRVAKRRASRAAGG